MNADWRTSYPAHLADLASLARSIRLAGVIHGWDLGRATGKTYDIEVATAEAVLSHVTQIAAEGRWKGYSRSSKK